MRIVSVRLKNIRSYADETITLPEGTVLLAGDIGAGKTTVLLAIEFALFGLLRGTTSGAGLLRNGTREGAVELTLQIEDKTITISRTLKRLKETISQEAGTLTINGTAEALTASELKARMLALLGYPPDLLNKNTALIYRYTVYAAQEDMKRILDEAADQRLETLRRLFNIDKYKRITDNTKMLLTELRARQALLDGRLAVLPRQQAELSSFVAQLATLDPTPHERALNEARDALRNAETGLKNIDAEYLKHTVLKRDLDVLRAQQRLEQAEKQRIDTELPRLAADIARLQNSIGAPVNRETIRKGIADTMARLTSAENASRVLATNIGATNARISQATELKTKIGGLSQCPLCLQNVTHEHKSAIAASQDNSLANLRDEHDRLTAIQRAHDVEATSLRKALDTLRAEETRAAQQQLATEAMTERQRRQTELAQRAQQLHTMLLSREENEQTLLSQIVGAADIERRHGEARAAVDAVRQRERAAELALQRVSQQCEQLTASINRLKIEIERHNAEQKLLTDVQQSRAWLSDQFIPLMGTMESNIFARVHQQFTELFQIWFQTLVGETLCGRLDESFGPLVTQDDHDISVSDLSGGERTACALAYRLALNRVINDLTTNVHTRDLLILDEPSDGFSSEQMDKLRDVLDQLKLKQVIIVSHEAKIEGFVQHVIRIEKDGHESRVA